MSNLLEKASILLTPTAYDDGKILSVKPEEVLGEELVVNGDFATDSDWTKLNSTISGGTGNLNGTGVTSLLYQNILTNGKTYKVTFTASDYNGLGVARVIDNSGLALYTITSNGTFTFTFTHSNANGNFLFRATSGAIFSIDNVSVKEDVSGDFTFTRNSSATRVNSQGLIEDVQILSSNLVSNGDFSQEGSELVTNGDFATDSDWTKQTSWSISGGAANYDFLSDAKYIRQTLLSGGFVAGKSYKINFEITSGTAYMNVSSNGGGLISLNTYSVGSYSIYVTASASGSDLLIYGRNTSGTAFSIDNVSVKEVGQGWTLGNGVTVGENKAIFTSTASGQSVSQNAVASSLTNGALAKVSFEVLSRTEGSFGVYFSGTLVGTLASAGVFTGYFTKGTETSFYIRALGTTSGSISNISVIEITDDTNLPRIDYEGFSYQDSLGSELVVNGDFSNGSTGWTIINGTVTDKYNASMTAYQSGIRIAPFSNTGTFKVVFDLVVTSGSCKFDAGGSNNAIYSTSGTKEIIVTNTTKFEFNAFNLGWVGTLDNVSVKEYLGQEVVPDSGCGSWLFEPQSTNLITQSENFSSVDWTKTLVTASANDAASPSGGVNASLIQETVYTSSIPSLRITNNIPISAGKHTLSFYVKNNSGRYLGISFGNNTNRIRTTFDFDTETFKTPLFNGITEGEVSYTTIGDYYRILITANFTSGIACLVYIMPLATDSYPFFEFQNSDNRSFYLWGAQVEASSYATSYIPTNGSTVTRLADAAFGAGSSDLINSTEGVLYAEIAALANENLQRISSISDGTANNTIQLGFLNSATNYKFFASVRVGGAFQAFMVYDFGAVQPTFKKVAVKYKQNDFALWIDGIKVVTDTSGNVPSGLNKLSFDRGDGGQDFYGKTKCLAVFKEALTDAELECLTTI